jgi:hypothetical protein
MDFEVLAAVHTLIHSVNRRCRRRRSKMWIRPYLEKLHLNSVLYNELRQDTYLFQNFTRMLCSD